MPYPDSFIIMVMGGVFLVIGVAVFFWGRRRQKDYYNSLSTRIDVKEFIQRAPERPEHSSVKIGGWVSIIVGLVLLGIGGSLRYWGWG